jgi:hypothetical protein
MKYRPTKGELFYTAWMEALADARWWAIQRENKEGSEFFRLWMQSLGSHR